jgi:hypothetical protein
MAWQNPQIRAHPLPSSQTNSGLPRISTPLRPSIEQDNTQEDYNNEWEWQDIDNDSNSLTADFSSYQTMSDSDIVWLGHLP